MSDETATPDAGATDETATTTGDTPDGGGGGGGDATDKPLTLTQRELDKIIGGRLRKLERELEKHRGAAEKAAKLEAENAELAAKWSTHRREVVRSRVREALVGAKAHEAALRSSLPEFESSAEIALDDDGEISSVTLEGESYDSLEKAAAAFLTARPYFAAATGAGGGGARQPSTGGHTTFDRMARRASPRDDIRAGLSGAKGRR